MMLLRGRESDLCNTDSFVKHQGGENLDPAYL